MEEHRPRGARVRRRRGAGIGLLIGLAVLAALLVVPGDEGGEEGKGPSCEGVRAVGWRQDPAMTEEFARYGDDNGRLDDWTGGDGTRSVRLPDGRTLWMSADTFLDQVHGGRTRNGNPVWVRNAGLVMSPQGRIERTLLGSAGGRPSALFPGSATADGREIWHWPVQAVVEPRAPGSSEKVVRVLLWQREAGSGPWVFGVPRATEVATLSLPDLRVESVRTVHSATDQPKLEHRVLYGTSAVTHDGWTYVYGADEGSVRGQASRAHLARVPEGRLSEPGAWRFWAGRHHGGWQRDPDRSRPILVGGTSQRGATGTYSVVRDAGTGSWLLLTMDAGGPHGQGMSDVASYWSCGPTGPWHGPSRVAKPPLPKGGQQAGAVPYNPQGHGEFGTGAVGATGAGGSGGDSLLMSYDVNVLDDTSAIHRDVSLYRPRFLRLRLAPAGK
ncbi:DUF4185 domain-containing protein [Streptomyces sp. ODS28]|uniref:DUF4185 domain-containing protein n=1 Tax=Streptomyces sp. ODS28 TaxID=3136688 RepID=UPI0031E9EAE4